MSNALPCGRRQRTLAGVGEHPKVISPDVLRAWRAGIADQGKTLVVTNGCFDLLHVGHVTYLRSARHLGDVLLVGLNSDASVSRIKGPDRPINSQEDRAVVLAALEFVDAVTIFPEDDARAFLTRVQPDIYAKGGDYTLDTINQEERRLVERMGGRVAVLGGVPNRSTTDLVERMKQK